MTPGLRTTCVSSSVRASRTSCRSTSAGDGARTPTKNINTPEAGYLIPIVAFPQGADALRGVGRRRRRRTAMAELRRADPTGGGGAVMSPLMTGADDYMLHLRAAMHEIEAQNISAFHAFTDEEVERCLGPQQRDRVRRSATGC